MSHSPAYTLVATAATALKDRIDEVNKLNVFPVPDGDTGTNMSLTMDAVIAELAKLPADASMVMVCNAITHGSLMGARGNSGVILSQMLRGLCEVAATRPVYDAAAVAACLARSVDVAYQAVRKPVEGTMLTVLKDTSAAAKSAAASAMSLDSMMDLVVAASFSSVRRTPDLLPILKENGVVDAGGYGLAILAEGLLAAYRGEEVQLPSVALSDAAGLRVEPADDWDDDEYLYCTEFLLTGRKLDADAISDFVSSAGGSELVVGDAEMLKIHVHTNDPGTVLSYMTVAGEVSDVHIHNMRRQSAERSATLSADETPRKALGVVTVAAGSGLAEILKSLGADVIVNGGQTMNPSTAEILEAVEALNADRVVILPNNKNIIMAANQAAEHATKPVAVVPTRSVPEAFSAMLALDPDMDLTELAAEMTQAAAAVRTGEVTAAIKDSVAASGPIKEGQIIGIANGEIQVVGEDVLEVAFRLVEVILGDAETITLLAGEELPDEQLGQLADRISSAHALVDVETHRGEQPLYPLILSAE